MCYQNSEHVLYLRREVLSVIEVCMHLHETKRKLKGERAMVCNSSQNQIPDMTLCPALVIVIAENNFVDKQILA